MPELRRDPVGGQWVIIAAERARRPMDFRLAPPGSQPAEDCPFCPGNEAATPPEIFALRDEAGWKLRVVPNRFPVLTVEGALHKRGEGIYDAISGVGAHEVIIESPQHVTSLTALSEERISEVLWTYKARLQDLKRDRRLVYGLLFKNVGERAGATLSHTHSQLIATPVVPIRVQNEIDRCARYHDFRGRCLLCDIVTQELASGARVAMESARFVALEPFAARSPFETHLVPKLHLSHYEALEDAWMPELAAVLRATMRKIEKALNRPAYNYLIHTAPLNAAPMEEYHWHLEIIPRIEGVAGFEWGTGFFVNSVPPEDAARYLRDL
ncbi:MAG: galactose-1-phosphate uridylyltransferase [Planctomycetes bacterium]|nr:galactose-1-phosphate uridylyltransferase [Planctomycetota bacterium]